MANRNEFQSAKPKWDEKSREKRKKKNEIGLWIVISIEFLRPVLVSNAKDNLTMNNEQHEKRSQNKYPNDNFKNTFRKRKFNCSLILFVLFNWYHGFKWISEFLCECVYVIWILDTVYMCIGYWVQAYHAIFLVSFSFFFSYIILISFYIMAPIATFSIQHIQMDIIPVGNNVTQVNNLSRYGCMHSIWFRNFPRRKHFATGIWYWFCVIRNTSRYAHRFGDEKCFGFISNVRENIKWPN